MATRNKGFDPLSSLFEAPDPARGVPLPAVDDEDELTGGRRTFELTDPLVKRPAPPPETDQADDAEEVLAEPQDKVALARRLAAEAMAKAKAATPAAPQPAQDKEALARRLAAEAMAKAQAAAPAAAPAQPAEDKEALARRLAAEAMAKAQAATPAPPQPAKPRKGSKPDKPSKPARKKAQRSRVSALTERARKPTSALEAARTAARVEERVAEEKAAQEQRKKANELGDVVQELIPAWLPGMGAVYVANAIAVQQREVLKALWKGHRSKFLADGQLERAVGAAAVLAALDQTPKGDLVAAHAVTDASDYLVWLDLDKRSLVAAFADARAYFAGG